jgi:hypothetical protein
MASLMKVQQHLTIHLLVAKFLSKAKNLTFQVYPYYHLLPPKAEVQIEQEHHLPSKVGQL